MTDKEKAIVKAYTEKAKEDFIKLCEEEDVEDSILHDAIERAIKTLEQEPCEDRNRVAVDILYELLSKYDTKSETEVNNG